MLLPDTERLLLGPGPSPVSARVLEALRTPQRSHLDPEMMAVLDEIRAQLTRVFQAPEGSLVLAISGTGTAAMEAAVANLIAPDRRVLSVVNGYFGDRLAQMAARYGAAVDRVTAEWGRAIDPVDVNAALSRAHYDIVTVVHAETSTGVRNPLEEIARSARAHDALVIADTVTSLGALPLDMSGWGVDVCYSCSQKGIGAPSGLSPLALSPRAVERRVDCRSFYLDLNLLSAYWQKRAYHHTISAPLVFAVHTALAEVLDEGLEARWQRHASVHRQFVDGLARLDMSLLPAPAERLWSLNAVRVPDGVSEAPVRAALLRDHAIEIGAGLGPLAGRIWRVGLMGSGATPANVARLLDALPHALPAGGAQ